MVVAVTRSPGLNQALEMARGALPTTMFDRPLMMAQMWQVMVKLVKLLEYMARHLRQDNLITLYNVTTFTVLNHSFLSISIPLSHLT